MVDIVDKNTRSKMMASVRTKDTKPEMMIRKALFANGFRYRVGVASLPGKPDLVFKKYHSVIFVHGCFWHQHNCAKAKLPETNHEFWKIKLLANKNRDKKNIEYLINNGWRVCIIWECTLKNHSNHLNSHILNSIIDFLLGNLNFVVVEGN